MRKIIILSLFVLLIANPAYPASIKFISNAENWQVVLNLAKQTHKKIFVDVYTEWCGPCKRMDAETFVASNVVEFYNKNFINVKIDAEKGWGKDFAAAYYIEAYPTYLYFEENGNLIKPAVGYLDAQVFLQMGKDIINNRYQANQALDNIYKSGKYDEAFLYHYIMQPASQGKDKPKMIDNYLELMDRKGRLSSDSVFKVLSRNRTFMNLSEDSLIFRAIYQLYQKAPLKTAVIGSPWSILRSAVIEELESVNYKDPKNLDNMIKMNEVFEELPYAKERETSYLSAVYYLNTGNKESFNHAFTEFFQNAVSNADTLALSSYTKAGFDKLFQVQQQLNKNMTKEQFKLSYRNEFLRTIEEFNALLFAYNRTNEMQSELINGKIKIWIPLCIKFYRANPVSVNPYFINNLLKYTK